MKIFLFVLLISLIMVGSIYYLLGKYYERIKIDRHKISGNITLNENGNTDLPSKQEERKHINVLLLGTDQGGYLTDSMLLVHYNVESRTTSLISIPRDYKIDLSPEMQEEIKTKHQFIKLTELNSYAKSAGRPSPSSYTTKAIEELTGVKIDHMVLFEIPAFKRLVDAVGGVEVYVPQNYHYDDPTQNLHIHLDKGTQVLNGKMAEGLVRFRQGNNQKGYGDFGRMEIQQYFFTAFIKKFVSLDTILNFNEIMESIADFIDTDASLNEAIGILTEIKNADFGRINSHTLPGTNNVYDGLYFYDPPAKRQLHALVQKWFEEDAIEKKSSKSFEIIVKNSGNSDKRCKEIVELLNSAGYQAKFGGYHDQYMVKSQIVVPEKGYGIDLKEFSSLAEIVVDKELIEEENAIYFIVGKIE
ncbi:MAG: LCP family protein [Bacillota bacterium]|nr:LCP family protein [Bacillota bacterium]